MLKVEVMRRGRKVVFMAVFWRNESDGETVVSVCFFCLFFFTQKGRQPRANKIVKKSPLEKKVPPP